MEMELDIESDPRESFEITQVIYEKRCDFPRLVELGKNLLSQVRKGKSRLSL